MTDYIRKLLKSIFVIQEVSNIGRNPKIGRGFNKAYRLNPYNPLSYISLVVIVIIGILMFGFLGFWKETDQRNPFKWN